MKRIFACALLALCTLPASADAASAKYGAVFPEVIMKESKFAQNASKKLTEEFSKREAAIAEQVAILQKLSTSFERDQPTLNEQQQTERKREIAELDRAIVKQQRDFQSELENRRRAEIQTVLDLINKVVLRIAREENYDFILQNVVYSSPSANLTGQVIREMDKELAQ